MQQLFFHHKEDLIDLLTDKRKAVPAILVDGPENLVRFKDSVGLFDGRTMTLTYSPKLRNIFVMFYHEVVNIEGHPQSQETIHNGEQEVMIDFPTIFSTHLTEFVPKVDLVGNRFIEVTADDITVYLVNVMRDIFFHRCGIDLRQYPVRCVRSDSEVFVASIETSTAVAKELFKDTPIHKGVHLVSVTSFLD